MSNKPLLPVKIAQFGVPHLLYLPLYAAIHGGFTKKAGLDIELIFAGNDDEIFNQVMAGKADFGFSDPIFVEIGKHKNQQAVCLALAVKRAGIWGITHNPAIPVLQKVEDFVQLRIGSFPKPSTTYSLIDGLKKKHKRLLKYTQVIEAPIGEQAALLTNNKADVILELEPMVSLAESRGMRAVFSFPQFYGDSAITGLIASQKTVDGKPELVDKMTKALERGLDVCLHDEKKSFAVAKHIFPDYPEDVLRKAILRLRDNNMWPETTQVDPILWKAAIALRRQVGDLPTKSETV